MRFMQARPSNIMHTRSFKRVHVRKRSARRRRRREDCVASALGKLNQERTGTAVYLIKCDEKTEREQRLLKCNKKREQEQCLRTRVVRRHTPGARG